MPQKVLIVDDSPTIRRIIQRSLRDEPLELLFASTGTEGLSLACSALPDLILLDVEMPPPDGFETCRLLKSLEATAGIPVVFLTKRITTLEKISGLDLGAIDYITKPFQSAELKARVRASLRTKYMFDLLARKAMIDGVTGLWNRTYFDHRLAQETSLSNRYGSALSIIMADIDWFKSINDTHGHPFGDQVLRNVANVLVSCCRKEDHVCRYGGEEFVILTPRIPLAGALALAERARQAISGNVVAHSGAEVRVTCSFGVSEFTPGGQEALVDGADAALYHAKQNGRNRVVSAGNNLKTRVVGGVQAETAGLLT